MKNLFDLEFKPGSILKAFSPGEAKQLAEKWLATFGGKGAPNTKDYLWHVFSHEAFPSVAVQEAILQYEQQIAPSFIILDNNRNQAIETNLRPISCSASDFLIFPPNMAWTMAFTHEDGWLGPYFAKHIQYNKLNRENIMKIEKMLEIENARIKGWI